MMTQAGFEIENLVKEILDEIHPGSEVTPTGANSSTTGWDLYSITIKTPAGNTQFHREHCFDLIHKGNLVINFSLGAFPDINLHEPESLELLKQAFIMLPNIQCIETHDETLRKIARKVRKDVKYAYGSPDYKKIVCEIGEIIEREVGY